MRNRIFLLVSLIIMSFGAERAWGHGVSIFATAHDREIHGKCYGAAPGAIIQVLGPDGQEIGESTLDDKAEFVFTAESAVDHTFVVDTDGHLGKFTITASELAGEHSHEESDHDHGLAGAPSNDLDHVVEDAVEEAIEPLRHQLDEYQRRATLHDILGGIGYIVGIMGLVFFLRGRKETKVS